MNKYAVISDIHSNIFALKAVVEDAKRKGFNKFVNLGDSLYGPIAPAETYQYLQSIDTIDISGNQDKQICNASEESINSNPTMKFIHDDINDKAQKWMNDLPFDIKITDEIYACHGTPNNDLIYLLEDTSNGFPVMRGDSEIIKLLGGISSQVILCGHTHIPRCVELSTGQLIINPGSVGLQSYTDDEPNIHSMENFSPLASYVTIEKIDNKWNASFHKIEYDIESAIQEAKKRMRMDWVHYLRTGRK